MSNTRPPRVKPTYALALIFVLGLAGISAPEASAQTSSLVVRVVSPSAGATVGGTVAVEADVTIIGFLTVRGVQFTLDGAHLGTEDTSSPYWRSWDTRTVSNGTHTLTAVARDALGILWTSSPVTITVSNDTVAPTVALTSPLPGAAVRGSISVTATATEDRKSTR